MRNLYAEPLCETLSEPPWQTSLRNIMRNLYAELREPESFCGTFLWNLGTCLCGIWALVRVEPLCGTLGNLVPGFGRLPQPPLSALLEEPQAFRSLKKNSERTRSQRHRAKEILLPRKPFHPCLHQVGCRSHPRCTCRSWKKLSLAALLQHGLLPFQGNKTFKCGLVGWLAWLVWSSAHPCL